MVEHKCYKPEDLTELVDAIHPASFANLPAEKFDRTRLGERAKEIPEGVLEAVYEYERRINQELAQYGSCRKEIADNLGRYVASCGKCLRVYTQFLDSKVRESVNEPKDLGRVPYESREDADEDFLHLGAIVNKFR